MKNTFEKRGINKLVIRTATENIKLETTYCTSCGFNHYTNIGYILCAKCGKNK